MSLLTVLFGALHSPGQANPLPDPMSLSEFSTNPDWVEVYGYAGSLAYVQFTVNGDTIRVKPDVIKKLIESLGTQKSRTERSFFVLDQLNTTGFDLPEGGGRIQLLNPLNYGIAGPVPAPPLRESAAAFSLNLSSHFVDESAWSLDGSPTPGEPNDNKPTGYGASTAVINEIFPGPAGESFIEIYNNGGAPADIGGWSIAANERFRIPPGTIIEPGGIHVYDASAFPPGFMPAGEAGSLCLQTADGTIVERAGWSGGRRPGHSLVRFPDGFATAYRSWSRETAPDFRESLPSRGAPNREAYPVQSIVIEQDSVTVIPGASYQFFCRGTDAAGQNFRMPVQWTLEGDFAAVDSRGILTCSECGGGKLIASFHELTAKAVVFGAVEGTLENDAAWSAKNSPYRVTGNLRISPDVTLAIGPGVEVLFAPDAEISVEGSIQAIGEEGRPIVFSSGGEQPAPGDWHSIRVWLGKRSVFNYCIFEYGYEGLFLHGDRGAYNIEPVHAIEHSVFRNNAYAIYCSDAKAAVSNCLFTGDASETTRGIFLSYSDSSRIVNNTFAFLRWGINMRNSRPAVFNNCIYSCETGISAGDGDSPATGYNNVFNTKTPYQGGFSGVGVNCMVNSRGDSCDIFHNISADPRFFAPERGDYRLRPGSPCIDAGDPSITDADGSVSDIGFYTGGGAVGAHAEGGGKAAAPELWQNAPNPFNPATTIRFILPAEGKASLTVYDSLGRKVCTLSEGYLGAGEHKAVFDGSRCASGMYFCMLRAGQTVETRKMLLVK